MRCMICHEEETDECRRLQKRIEAGIFVDHSSHGEELDSAVRNKREKKNDTIITIDILSAFLGFVAGLVTAYFLGLASLLWGS